MEDPTAFPPLEVQLAKADAVLLRRYCETADVLAQSKQLVAANHISIRATRDPETGTFSEEVEAKLAPPDLTAGFGAYFRQLYGDGEPRVSSRRAASCSGRQTLAKSGAGRRATSMANDGARASGEASAAAITREAPRGGRVAPLDADDHERFSRVAPDRRISEYRLWRPYPPRPSRRPPRGAQAEPGHRRDAADELHGSDVCSRPRVHGIRPTYSRRSEPALASTLGSAQRFSTSAAGNSVRLSRRPARAWAAGLTRRRLLPVAHEPHRATLLRPSPSPAQMASAGRCQVAAQLTLRFALHVLGRACVLEEYRRPARRSPPCGPLGRELDAGTIEQACDRIRANP
jgi:hypothetical protein